MHEKLKSEIPSLFWPTYADHDFSIYDQNVQLLVYRGESKPIKINGFSNYRNAYHVAKRMIMLEMKSPKMEIMSSKMDMKLGEIEIKWRIIGDSKLNYTLGRILPIAR